MEGAMAVAWRSTCLILLLVASFQLATIVQAQTDYSFSRWLDARERLTTALAAEKGISVEAALEQMRHGLPESLYVEIIREMYPHTHTPAELRRADLEQFEKDKAEAAERGTTVEAVLAERLAEQRARARLAQAKAEKEREKERADAKKRQAIQLAVAATIAIVVVVIVFRARRIAAAISRRWQGRSKAFRAWAFGSFFWAVGTLLFVWLAEPYGRWMDKEEFWHMFSVMIVPPLFLGAVWFGYKRFVDLEVADMQPTDFKTGPEDHAEED